MNTFSTSENIMIVIDSYLQTSRIFTFFRAEPNSGFYSLARWRTRICGNHFRACLFMLLSFCFSHAVFGVTSSIGYVQGNYATPQSSKSSVAVKYNVAQTAGDLNIIVVGWNDSSAAVKTVTDASGNVYSLALGPTVVSGALTQSIYFAKNIAAAAAGRNIVTVTFSKSAAYPDIRILEYSGADPVNPIDTVAANSGSSSPSNASTITTNPTDLIFAANVVQSATNGPGSGFTKRILTSPDADIAEDHMAATAGGYTATAPISNPQPWIMQVVAVRLASGAGGPALGGTSALSINATNIAFGNVNLNTTATQSLTLTSTGSSSVTVNSATITGTGFSYSGVAFPLTLGSNQSVMFSVDFDPLTAGAATGQLTINSDSSTNPTAAIGLAGTGQAAASYSVSVSWQAPANSADQVAGYHIYRSPGGGSSYQLLSSVSSTQLAYMDNGAQNGQTYDYIVESVDASGIESVPSNMATVTVP